MTKHNLRLLILEDILSYHSECRSLVQPDLATATAAMTPATGTADALADDERRASPGVVTAPPSIPPVAELARRRVLAGESASLAPGAFGGVTAYQMEGLHGVPVWPPNEAAGPVGGLWAGPAAGAAGWTKGRRDG